MLDVIGPFNCHPANFDIRQAPPTISSFILAQGQGVMHVQIQTGISQPPSTIIVVELELK